MGADTRVQTFRNPKPDLLAILKDSGPAGEANGTASSKPQKRKPASRNVDMEKLAEALPQLQEDDLLQIVQMVHDNKTDDTYTKNDLESKLFPEGAMLVWSSKLTLNQTANSTSTSTPYQTISSRCSGTSPQIVST